MHLLRIVEQFPQNPIQKTLKKTFDFTFFCTQITETSSFTRWSVQTRSFGELICHQISRPTTREDRTRDLTRN